MNELTITTVVDKAKLSLGEFVETFSELVNPEIEVIKKSVDLIYDFTEANKKNYTVEAFGGDIDKVTKGRAELNKAETEVSKARKDFEKAYKKPIESITETFKKTELSISQASSSLDEVVKKIEAMEKEDKKNLIDEYWRIKGFTAISLDQIFDQRWLNKTYKIKDVKSDIDSMILKTTKDLQTIEQFGVEVETVKAMYLRCLDIGKAIEEAQSIKNARERAIVEEKERAEREELRIQEEFAKREIVENAKQTVNNTVSSFASQALGVPEKQEVKMFSFTLKFTCTDAQRTMLKEFMLKNGIKYEQKVSVSSRDETDKCECCGIHVEGCHMYCNK